MFGLTYREIDFVGLFLEAFLYGLYSGVFAMYSQYQASKKDTNFKTQNVIFYSICLLYVLSVVLFVFEIAGSIYENLGESMDSILHIDFIVNTSFGCCDFIAQLILIYRCWIMWGRNLRVVTIPLILTLAFLATWVAGGTSDRILSRQFAITGWVQPVLLTSLAISLTVNALVTGLIVFRIFKVFREVKATSDDQILRASGGSTLRPAMSILIESGVALLSIQLVRLVVTVVWTDAAYRAFNFVVTIHQILIGITPTIILVRISMGLSFHDEKSMEEVAIGSLCFASSHLDSVLETGSIGAVDQHSRDDSVGVQRCDDIDLVER